MPVFGVGGQDGQHYYVMQFITGLGLDLVIEEIKRLRPATTGGVVPEPAHPADQLDELLPDVWFASHPSARRKTAA